MFHVSKHTILYYQNYILFLLELIRSAHVGNLPVVVVSEVVAGAGTLVHQVVRPLPGAEVPQVNF